MEEMTNGPIAEYRPASPRKLRSGEWGVQAPANAKVGEIVEVTTRAGKTWFAKITKIEQASSEGAYVICTTTSDCS